MIFPAIILFLLVLIMDLWIDYNKWLHNHSVNHSRKAWVRFAFLLPSLTLFYLAASHTLLTIIAVLGMAGFIYLTLFDGLYNVLRGFKWTFTGSDEGAGDAWTDRIQRRLGPMWSMVVKWMGIAGFVALYYTLLK
jgi:hypothetical protein